MDKKIILTIKTNLTNGHCTDEESDCQFLGWDHKESHEVCQLFGGDVSSGPCETCVKHREEIDKFLLLLNQEVVFVNLHQIPDRICNIPLAITVGYRRGIVTFWQKIKELLCSRFVTKDEEYRSREQCQVVAQLRLETDVVSASEKK